MDFLQNQVKELLDRGMIQPSRSPYGSPVFLVKKPGGSFRLVIDYRRLNDITIKQETCMPHPDDLFDMVQGARYFSKLDMHSGYWQVLMDPASVDKTAMTTPFGSFEWLVLPMGLSGAPATFTAVMNDLFRTQLRKSVVVFLDDILVFSKTWEEHLVHLREVLSLLKEHKFYAKPSKCSFGAESVHFFGTQDYWRDHFDR
jgi:hypothetical protein